MTQNNLSGPAGWRWSMQDIVLMVVLGVVFGFSYWALAQGMNALRIVSGPIGDLSQHFLFGAWLLVAPISVAIIRRPFTGIIAEVLAGVVELLAGFGPVVLLSAAIQGAGCELPFALTGYRRFGWVVFGLSGLVGACAIFFFTGFRLGWYGQDIIYLRFIVQAISGVVLGGLLAKVIVDALARTGVVDNFAIGQTLNRL